jgi:hypothetical protein
VSAREFFQETTNGNFYVNEQKLKKRSNVKKTKIKNSEINKHELFSLLKLQGYDIQFIPHRKHTPSP